MFQALSRAVSRGKERQKLREDLEQNQCLAGPTSHCDHQSLRQGRPLAGQVRFGGREGWERLQYPGADQPVAFLRTYGSLHLWISALGD
jgi:hypothetical protein